MNIDIFAPPRQRSILPPPAGRYFSTRPAQCPFNPADCRATVSDIPGDRFVIYTDDVNEAVSPEGEFSGTERCIEHFLKPNGGMEIR
ncbi:MAG: hypothetical protein P9M08_06540 [Candidatus Erginobacter occultus]|nr:hypothetical protein [Candidatus Erginobacter occultus]